MSKSTKEKKPIGERTGLLIFISLIFAPVGLYLVWKYKKEWPKFIKIALSAVASCIFIISCFGVSGNEDIPVDVIDQQQQEVVERSVIEKSEDAVQAEEEQQKEVQEVQDGSLEQAEQEKLQEMVLITNTGKRYHRYACTEGDYFEVTLEQAESMGLTPCKNCY